MKKLRIANQPSIYLISLLFACLCFNINCLETTILQNQQPKENTSILLKRLSDYPALERALLNEKYQGTFSTNQEPDLFDYLQTKSGNIQLYFNEEYPPKSNGMAADLLLFDPYYHDEKAAQIKISLTETFVENTWKQQNVNSLQLYKFWKERGIANNFNLVSVDYSIELINVDINDPDPDPDQIQIRLKVSGKDFSFEANLNHAEDLISTLSYCLYITLIIVIEIVCAYYILRNIELYNVGGLGKMSLLTISMCNIIDFNLTMTHVEEIMSTGGSYLFFILPAIAYIILFVVFDMKLLFLIWRTHNLREIDNPQALRKKLTTFYIQFYFGLFAYLTLSYFFAFDSWMIILQNLFYLPQIIHNVKIGNNPGFSGFYILGYLGARLLVPLYERGCPSNHFRLSPDTNLVVILCIVYFLGILITFLQSKLGSRFFVPKKFLPNYYDYDFKLKLEEGKDEEDCTICMQNIFSTESHGQILNEELLSEVKVMKTPCNHYFHKDCLAQWMNVKLECPTCRSILPPL